MNTIAEIAKRPLASIRRFSAIVMRHLKMLLALCWLLGGVPYLIYELVDALSVSGESDFGDVRAILLTLAAWIGAPFLIWRTLLADRQTHISQETYYTDLFIKAIESLGATRLDKEGSLLPATESRIGALYSLERLSKHSQKDYGVIVETLSAYIREQCGSPIPFEYQGADPDEGGISIQEKEGRLRAWCEALWDWIKQVRSAPPANRGDVKVALTILSRRGEGRLWQARESEETQPNLNGANLQGAILTGITKGLVQSNTGILHAHVDGAAFSGFDLEGSIIVRPKVRHGLQSSTLSSNRLVGAHLLGLTLKNTDFFPVLDGADISFANMYGSHCNNGSFRGAKLVRGIFRNAKVGRARFGCANASDAVFDGADLSHSEFIGTLLHDASFVGADLSHTQFQGALLRGAILRGALLIGADLSGAHELEEAMIAQAFGAKSTTLPNSMPRPEHWKDDVSATEKWHSFRIEHE
ncbi:MAG: pentapeptide repeat-containing protein [Dehalococcoidia bacterium]|nr:pentapeptide repeat-containing protein [Dehalococcoidia bacterium]